MELRSMLEEFADELHAIRSIRWFRKRRMARRLNRLMMKTIPVLDDSPESEVIDLVLTHIGLGIVMVGTNRVAFDRCLLACEKYIQDHVRETSGKAVAP